MKINHLRLIILIILMIPLVIHAQSDNKSSFRLGLRVAPSVGWISTSTTGYESDGIRFSANAGLVTDIYFTKNYALSTGFSFLFPTGTLSYRDSLLRDNAYVAGQLNNIYKFIYFEIPVMLKMKTNQFGQFSFYGQVGFGTAFRMSAKAKAEFTPDGTTTSQSSDLDINNKTSLMRESVLAGIGLEYHIDKSTSLTAGFNYSNSLNNVFNTVNMITYEELKGLPNYLELNIGIFF